MRPPVLRQSLRKLLLSQDEFMRLLKDARSDARTTTRGVRIRHVEIPLAQEASRDSPDKSFSPQVLPERIHIRYVEIIRPQPGTERPCSRLG